MARDPLRGNLFENLVIAEALKFRLHNAKSNNLYFYRDSSGNEVDLLIKSGPDLFPIEIKAGMTITGDYFKGLKKFAKLFELPLGSGLVFGGKSGQKRTGTDVRSFAQFPKMLRDVEERLAEL